jgi:hypothetical protein
MPMMGAMRAKASTYHNFWRFIKLAINASLRERPFFYFYVESPPSIFMHHLREHSCHSEYNVHYPKVFIDWFMMLVSLVLKLLVSSRPLKLEGVLCIYVLLSHEGLAENHLLCFSIWFEHTFDFHCLIFMIFCLCSFLCYNMVAKFLLSRLCLHAHVLSSFDPSAQCLHICSRFCRCMSPQKLFLLLSLTYSRTSRS